jgi:salicylate hydroxylase
MRVIIAGGGIGGLATAIAVRKFGFEPYVLERKEELGDVGAGLGLYPNAMKAMTWLGADAYIREKSVDNARVESRILETDELLVNRLTRETARLYGETAYTVHRADLHMALAQQVPPEDVRLDARVVGVKHTRGGVVAQLQNGEEIEGDVLVGADGLRSNVRTCLFGEQEARFTGIVTWRCIIPAEKVSSRYQNIQIVWFGDNRHAMIYGVRENAYCLNAFVPADEVHPEAWGVMGDVSQLPGLYPGACRALEDILHAVDSALVTPIYFRDPLEEWSVGHATMLGDAAHPAPPSAGQGAAMALEDALVLAHALKRHGHEAIPAALADYANRRKARTRAMLLQSRVQLRVHNQPDAVQREARNTWLRGTEQLEPGVSLQNNLWSLDPVAHATGPASSIAPVAPKSTSQRPDIQRAFAMMASAITPEERTRQWVGEREGYARFLESACPVPSDVEITPVDCDGVPALMIEPPKRDLGLATILYLHGGGYTMGSARGAARVASQFARAIGAGALAPDYRLAPEHPYPAALDDCVRAYEWLLKQTNGDIIVSGEAGGGGLAVALMLRLRDAKIRLPTALHLISPFTDMRLSGNSIKTNGPNEPLNNRDSLKNQAASYIGRSDLASPLVSPVSADLSGFPPMLIQAAANEALADDANRLAAAAEHAGVTVALIMVPDSLHAFPLFEFLPESKAALAQFAAFVATVAKQQA